MSSYIIIGFSTHKKFSILSSLIKCIEGTKFSHVYLKFESKSINRKLIYQASGLTVNFCGNDIFYSKNKDIAQFVIPVTEEEKIKILQKCVDLCGKPYGIKELFGLGLVKICAIYGKKIKNPFQDRSRTYICSELIATILMTIGFTFKDLDSVSPKDLFNKLSSK